MLKFALLLVMLHALPQFSNAQYQRKDWLLTAPGRVRVTRGSCLVIPCTYSPPKTFPTYNGLLLKGMQQVVVAQSNTNPSNDPDDLRISFLGPVHERNCTWMLKDIRDSDAGLYFFKLEMPGFPSYIWSYQPTKLVVVGEDYPEMKLVSGMDDVLAHCSLFYSCPQNPPSLTWNTNGTTLSGSNWVDNWQWMTFSILQFRPQQNTNLDLRCIVKH